MIRRVLATQSLAKRTARSQDDFFNGLLARVETDFPGGRKLDRQPGREFQA